ncbi:MAG: hypothetical protein R3223_06525 [Longimicrobiales bacterium]|nr:hypothetical protein [Longimicrobiales bacterium]
MAGPIAFVTCSLQPSGTPDDRLAVDACARRGLEVISAPWDDPTIPWDDFAAIVIRSTWDYHRKLQGFHEWIDLVEASPAAVFNDPDTLRWNVVKSYLFDLSEVGVPVIPGVRIDRPTQIDPGELRSALGTPDSVVKPLVGAWGDGMFRLSLDGPGALARLERAAEAEPILVQRYVPEIVSRGEWSLIYLGGRYSHAIRKTPAAGEFRVHEERGGHLEGLSPPAIVRETADHAAEALPGILDVPPLYARVDLVEGGDGPLLMELELVEPALYFEFGPGSEDRFAAVLVEALEQRDRG